MYVGEGSFGRILEKIFPRGRLNPVFREKLALSLTFEIFFHNWKVAFVTVLGGVLTPITPTLIDLLNGVIIGFVASVQTPYEFLVTIMPHGIIEIPSLIIAVSAGLKLGKYFLKSLEEGVSKIKQITYVAIGLAPFLFTAALIESIITPFLIKKLLNWT